MARARGVQAQRTVARGGIIFTIVTSIAALGLGVGRDAMDRGANHTTAKVTDVYDRHGYADEDKRIMAAVARLLLSLVEGEETTNVVSLR